VAAANFEVDQGGLRRVLNESQAALLQQEMQLLDEVISLLEKVWSSIVCIPTVTTLTLTSRGLEFHQLGASKEDVELVVHTREQLGELFLLVVVGEFNAGKSAFLNALLGHKHLKEGGTSSGDIADASFG